MPYPIEIITTRRATYWEVDEGTFQATRVGEAPKTTAGYRSLPAIMSLKGEPWETKAPYIQSALDRLSR